MAIVVFIGFSRTFFLKPLFPEAQEFAAPETIFYVHGFVFAAWMLFLVFQAFLISRRNTALHRRTGWFGAALAVAVVCLGIYGATVAAQRPGGFIGVPFPPQQFLVIPFTAMLFFGLFATLAIICRKRPDCHKRSMVLATVNLLEAAFIRFPIPAFVAGAPLTTFGAACLFIVAMAIYDRRTLGRIHRVTLWGGLAIILSLPTAFLLSTTQGWLGFAGWLVELLH